MNEPRLPTESPSKELSPRFAGMAIPTLTDQQRTEFDRNGFLIVEHALTNDEISRYRHVLERFDHTISENYGGVINSAARKAGEHLELRNAVAQADELLDLMVQPTTFPLLTQLMNGHITLTTSHVFIRPTSPKGTKKDSKQIGWHRDGPAYGASEQNGVLPWLITKIGYFLTDTTIPDCAALRVIPGSHKYAGPAPIAEDESEPYGAIEVKVKAGSAVFLDNRLFHSVGPNLSSVARETIYIGYCWRYLKSIDFVEQPKELLDKGTPIQRQLLGDASSPLAYFLPSQTDTPLADWMRNSPASTPLSEYPSSGQIDFSESH